MKQALKQLIDDLDAIFEEHEELGDTDVREQMAMAIHQAFIAPQPDYALAKTFGMFSEEGNSSVREALDAFLEDPDVVAAKESLGTPQDRLDAFQDISVESDEGNTYDEYFGYTETP
jgi:hypothetical protein